MELLKTNKKIKCDVVGCKNLSEYCFEMKKQLLAGNKYYCKGCLNEMYSVIGKELIPQSIKNVYKKNSQIKEEM